MWIEDKKDSCLISIHVQPRASKNEISGVHGDALKVRLTSPPVEGAANALLVEFMAKKLGVPKSRVELASGEKSRYKTLKIEALTTAEATTRLGIPA